MRTSKIHIVAFFAAFWCSNASASEAFPDRTVRLIVQFTPGGTTDLLARGLARYLGQRWNVPVVVENKPGAGGLVASRAVLDAPHDGYTLGLYSDSFAVAPAIFAKLPYNPARDFQPLVQIALAPNVVVVGASSPYKTLAELVEAGKTKGSLSYGTSGVGSAMHMQAAEFAARVGLLDPVHVPFRGTPESLVDVMAGRVDFAMGPFTNAVPLINSGQLRALAVSSSERSPLLPQTPTVAESGYPGFAQEQWWGLIAPSGVSPETISTIVKGAKAGLDTSEMKELVAQLYSVGSNVADADFVRLVNEDIIKNQTTADMIHLIRQ
jgi:tripartite-type tricarboxylate transporter receptor subunit TctC